MRILPLTLIFLGLLACQTPQTLTAPERTESFTFPEGSWTQQSDDDGSLLSISHKDITIAAGAIPRIHVENGAQLHTLAWLESTHDNLKVVSRTNKELVVAVDGTNEVYKFVRGAQLDYVIKVTGTDITSQKQRKLWEPVVASFTPHTDTVTRTMHNKPSLTILNRSTLTLTREMQADKRTQGLVSSFADKSITLHQHHTLIVGDVLNQILPYEISKKEVMEIVQERLQKKHGPTTHDTTTGILLTQDPDKSSLVPMTHMTRVILRGVGLYQITLSTPSVVFSQNQAFMKDLILGIAPQAEVQ